MIPLLCRARSTNGYCTVYYVFIRYVSCHTLCFCFNFLPGVDPNFFSVMYINTNHIIGRLKIFFFSSFFLHFLFLFFLPFLIVHVIYLMNILQLMTDIYQSPCYLNKYPICSTFKMSFVTWLDFELLDNVWYSHSISCCNRKVLLRW